ncbi:MAG: hypothetical protein IVW54_03345 [Candidatus Binataceae bacterium]|nr:hypothetical protein [Candidatus Binataceae bacterium]
MQKTRIWAALATALVCVLIASRAGAIGFYELQLYYVDTVPQYHLMVELHSISVISANGALAHQKLPVYQIHNTTEFTYGLLPWLEVGQYLATARFNTGAYQYAGARTKVHFGIPQTESWPISFGMNVELDYMSSTADPNPLSLDVMPIAQAVWGKWTVVGNFALSKPFNGPGNKNIDFQPAGGISYRLLDWLEPGLEYFGDLGPMTPFARLPYQEQFITPSINLLLNPRLEFNAGVGFGLTRGSNGTFVKSTVGWLF